MVEQTRDIVRRFNRLYGETLVLPEALVSEVGARLPGTDGQAKMGASLNNAINLKDPADLVHRKVMSMYTDPTRLRATDPGHVEGNPVFGYPDAFDPDSARVRGVEVPIRTRRHRRRRAKRHLAEVLESFLAPIRQRRRDFESRPEELRTILGEGTRRGRKVVAKTLAAVLTALGLGNTETMLMEAA